jgi:hypothetical protein
MAQQMDRRPKTPRPSPSVMPVWAWFQWDGHQRRKPDLRAVRFWHSKGERAVRVECQVQDERVLLSDCDLWHYVLNCWYLPSTMADGEAFEKKLDAAGFATCRAAHDTPLPGADYRHEIEASWERIFHLEWLDPDLTHTSETKSIQATLWELLLEDVVDATEFVGAGSVGRK